MTPSATIGDTPSRGGSTAPTDLESAALIMHRSIMVERHEVESSAHLNALGYILFAAGFVSGPITWLIVQATSGRQGLAIGVGIAVGLFGCSLGLVALGVMRRERSGHDRTRARVADARRNLAALSKALCAELDGTLTIERTAQPTALMLNEWGVRSVPNLLLARLFGGQEERHRIVGVRNGAPVAIVVALGEPASVYARVNTSMSRGSVGPHLFVVLPGVATSPTERPAQCPALFDVLGAGSDRVLVASLDELDNTRLFDSSTYRPPISDLPDAKTIVAAIDAFGTRSETAPLDASETPITYSSATDCARTFLAALAARDWPTLMCAMDPQLMMTGALMPCTDSVERWATELAPHAGQSEPVVVATSRLTTAVTCRVGPKEVRWELQLIQHPAHHYRVAYIDCDGITSGCYDSNHEPTSSV